MRFSVLDLRGDNLSRFERIKAPKVFKKWGRAHKGTIFYQTSSKQSQSFWLLIGARKRWCFYAQTCRAHLACESFVFSYMPHK